MKKLGVLLIALLVLSSGAFAQVNVAKIKDGVYFAESDSFGSSGWKGQVVVVVSKGKIVEATWNGVSNIAGAADKKSYAAAGKYGMVKASKIKAEWDAQAKAVEEYLVKTQDIDFSKMDKNGHPDGISGASLSVSEFFALAKEALKSEPVAKGSYKDGWYYKEGDKFENGWKDSVLITVVNGTIVDVVFNGINSDATKKSKLIQSEGGTYKMNAKNGEWFVQANRLEKAIVKAGDPAKIAFTKEGKTDAVSGVSITVSGLLNLASAALKAAK